eukprot:CAMPEP_0184279514 /NCGR_PEP_ID=MMETSP0977-20130417/56069_1 /TAXON_ID=483370 /ORGANISM="non described non described, Strain CCMP2097" /LENGTH=184 /DNA_ID=CAMNT_0026585457 /DNA_START=381 /DNA_END=929 /DNA_ORIENTATION=+
MVFFSVARPQDGDVRGALVVLERGRGHLWVVRDDFRHDVCHGRVDVDQPPQLRHQADVVREHDDGDARLGRIPERSASGSDILQAASASAFLLQPQNCRTAARKMATKRCFWPSVSRFAENLTLAAKKASRIRTLWQNGHTGQEAKKIPPHEQGGSEASIFVAAAEATLLEVSLVVVAVAEDAR